jgi:thiamine-monophosphate kinase
MVMSQRGEFGFIDYIKANFPVQEGTIGIGDDCAVMPAGEGELLFSTDLLMEGVHFLRNESSPEDVGWKAAAVNLSDIAAMGGTPVATFLSIALPKDAQGEWAERFIDGYTQISRKYDVPLLGGDTTSSLRDIAVNVGVLGRCPSGKRLMRNGAKAGETIYVTGPLGDSAGGLQAILKGIERTEEVKTLIERHKRPVPRIDAGRILMESGQVGAMMDISDGIASDINHITELSKVGARIELNNIPTDYDIRYATTGGEDYELLLTVAPKSLESLTKALYEATGTTLTKIGEITDTQYVEWLEEGKPTELELKGFTHF